MLHHIFSERYVAKEGRLHPELPFLLGHGEILLSKIHAMRGRLDTQIKGPTVCRMEKLLNAHSFI